MTTILGLNSAFHESSACLLVDGRVIGAVEEERFTRVKHAKPARVDNPDELPLAAIAWCLGEGGLGAGNPGLDATMTHQFRYQRLPC